MSLVHNRRHAARRKAMVNVLKVQPCTDCGVQYPGYVMDFDHRDPAAKSFTISTNLRKPWAVVLEEIAKCDLVCANCHRERTHGYTGT